MKLVVGLGNPGRKYQGTRHNVGFDTVAEVALRHGVGQWHFKIGQHRNRAIANSVYYAQLCLRRVDGEYGLGAFGFCRVENFKESGSGERVESA